MKTKLRKMTALLLVLSVLLSLAVSAAAFGRDTDTLLLDSSTAMFLEGDEPQGATSDGDWTVIGLARGNLLLPEDYYDSYYRSLERHVESCRGVLHTRDYTEYARVVLALTAIGRDPSDVGGYDLLAPLESYDGVAAQGLNGPVWALLALDAASCAGGAFPDDKAQAVCRRYVDYLLSRELPSGGFALSGKMADPEMTAMVLQALAPHRDRAPVQAVIERGLERLSALQNDNGGFSFQSTPSSESCAQVLIALCTLGVSPEDSRFVKNGHSVTDALLTYHQTNGTFAHAVGGGSDLTASLQGLCALAALWRAETGQTALYDMRDSFGVKAGADGLPGKHPDVTPVPLLSEEVLFSDLAGSPEEDAVSALAARGIVNGMGDGTFLPNQTMTRAEFAAITVRALGLPPAANSAFTDVTGESWYAPYVGTAYTYGIVNGVGEGVFDPSGTITRQEAAAMVARAAGLCGLDTVLSDSDMEDALSPIMDAPSVAGWARESVSFCYLSGIWDSMEGLCTPTRAILRGEIAQMLYTLLDCGRLL